jgi:hypothetical protein
MSPRARKYYLQTFLPRYRELHDQIKETPLGVLVWGPGASGGDLYDKRLQIRDVLRNHGDAAVFSEEVDEARVKVELPLNVRELLQALAADFIVVIYGSPGAIAETHDFTHFLRDVGSKMLVFIDERHVTGYGYSGSLQEMNDLYHNVHTYKYPGDIRDCHLLGAVQKRLSVLRTAKWKAGLE